MPRRKRMPRPPGPHGSGDSPFDLDRDVELLEDMLAAPRDGSGRPRRPVTVTPQQLGAGPLAQAWYRRVDQCGVDPARYHRGLGCLFDGAVIDLQVRRRRLEATVQGTRRYLVGVDFLPPSALTHQVAAQVRDIRARVPAGPEQTAAIRDAIAGAGPAVLPTAQQMIPACSCPDGPTCKHFVAVVHGFGALLEAQPHLLLIVWGFDPEEVAPPATQFTLMPLAPGKIPLTGDLGQLFGITLAGPLPAPRQPQPRPRPAVTAPPPPAQPAAPAPEFTHTPVRPRSPDPDPVAYPPRELSPSQIRREDLRALGLTARTIDAWLREGVLHRTDHYGIYQRTPEADRRLDEFVPE